MNLWDVIYDIQKRLYNLEQNVSIGLPTISSTDLEELKKRIDELKNYVSVNSEISVLTSEIKEDLEKIKHYLLPTPEIENKFATLNSEFDVAKTKSKLKDLLDIVYLTVSHITTENYQKYENVVEMLIQKVNEVRPPENVQTNWQALVYDLEKLYNDMRYNNVTAIPDDIEVIITAIVNITIQLSL